LPFFQQTCLYYLLLAFLHDRINLGQLFDIQFEKKFVPFNLVKKIKYFKKPTEKHAQVKPVYPPP